MSKQKHTVMIVEPDGILRESYAKQISNEYEIQVCSSAQEAIEQISINLPDLILLELMMPEHSGFDLIYDLQSYVDSQDIPIVLLTFLGRDDIGLNDEIKERLSIRGCLYKPTTTPEKLLKEIKSLLGVMA